MSNSSGKKLVVNSIIYSFSGIMLKCFNFFLLPLYTIYLTTEDYGVTSIATSFISTMSYIVVFSLFSAVMRFYVDLKDDQEKLKRFYGTIVVFSLCSGMFFCLLITFCREIVARYIFSGVDFYPVILVCLVSLLFACQYSIYDNILRSQQKAVKSSLISIVFFIITFLCNIVFVVVLKMGAVGSLLSTMMGYILCSGYIFIEMLIDKKIVLCFDIDLLKSALKYSIPIMPHNLSTSIALLISKVLIGGTASLASVGVYTVASQFGNIADTIQGYVDQAYGPWLYEKLHAKEKNYKEDIRGIVKLLIGVIGLFFLGISLFAHDYIVLFVESSYIDAWKYVPGIVIVFAIKTIYYFYVEVLFYYKEASNKLFIATLTSSIVNIVLSYFFIPLYGVYGSIFADLLSMLIRVSIIVTISKKYENIGLRISDFVINFVIVLLFITVGLIPSFYFFTNMFNVGNFCYKVVVVLAYLCVVAILNRKNIKVFARLLKHKKEN